eukprot:GFYU01003287.1.p1 GENE.GFYU01003287.1~~GFYU01003287.1.p1  ORF type:complete len:539 (-),score=151.26 GFYU01003287.1:174-1790(-)
MQPKVFFNKWVTLVAGMFMLLCGGTMYVFGVYSDQLKKDMNYTQTDIDSVGSTANVGGYLGIVAGLFYDRFGPRRTAWTGAAIAFTGYFLLYLAASKTIDSSLGTVCLFAAIGANSQTWYDSAVLATNVRNFPMNRGLVVGLLKSFTGLSASVFTQVYVGFISPDAIEFLLLLGLTIGVMGLIVSLFLNVVPDYLNTPDDNPSRFYYGYGIVGVLALYLTTVSVVEKVVDVSDGVVTALAVLSLVSLLTLFGLILRTGQVVFPNVNATGLTEGLVAGEERRDSDGRDGTNMDNKSEQTPSVQINLNPLQTITSLRFWLLIGAILAGTGGGLAYINNLAQLVKALSDGESNAAALVSITSIANCCGRLLAGYLSDTYMHKLSRPAFLIVFLISMAAGQLLAAFATLNMLYPVSILIGVSFGAFWCLLPSISAELFGLEHFGGNYNLGNIGPIAGSFLLSSQLAGKIYDSHTEPGSKDCYGPDCFRLSFAIISALCVGGAGSAFILWRNTKKYYEDLYEERLHAQKLVADAASNSLDSRA